MANDFTGDSNCVALWRMESGALTTDSIGSNTLTDYGTVESETTIIKEGSGSSEFTKTTENALYIDNGDLDSDVPFKSGGDVNMTLSCWFRLKSLPSAADDMTIICKFDYDTVKKLSWRLKVENSDNKLYLQTGYGTGVDYQEVAFGTACAVDTWYHVTITTDDSSNYRIRVWDDTAGALLDTDVADTFANTPVATVSKIVVGNFQEGSGYSTNNWLNGYVDEVVMFNRVLTIDEIDAIRAGTFTQSENDFTGDSSCISVHNFESGALTTDSKGSNTLTNVNTVTSNTTDYKQGAGSADFEGGNSEYFIIADADLDSGHPLKSGGSGVFTIAGWLKLESMWYQGTLLVSKGDWSDNTRSMNFGINAASQKVFLTTGYNSGANWHTDVLHASALSLDTWYHVAVTLDADNNYRIRIWDDTAGAILGTDLTGTFTNAINIESSNLLYGSYYDDGNISAHMDGELDEWVVFSRVLTPTEIDAVRAGTFTSGTTVPIFMSSYLRGMGI